MESKKTKKPEKSVDLFTQFFVEYGLWINYIFMLITAFLPPFSFSSLIYLLFLFVFIGITLQENDSKKVQFSLSA